MVLVCTPHTTLALLTGGYGRLLPCFSDPRGRARFAPMNEDERDFHWIRPTRFWTCLVVITLPTTMAATWESIVGRDWVSPSFMESFDQVGLCRRKLHRLVVRNGRNHDRHCPFTRLRNRRTMHHRVLAAMLQKTSPKPTSCWRLEAIALPFPALLSQRGLFGAGGAHHVRCRQTSDRNRCYCSSCSCVAPTRTGSWTGAEVRGRFCAIARRSRGDRTDRRPDPGSLRHFPAIRTILESVLRGMHQVDPECIPRCDVPLLTSVLRDPAPGRCAGTFGTTGTIVARRSREVRSDCPGVFCGWRCSSAEEPT